MVWGWIDVNFDKFAVHAAVVLASSNAPPQFGKAR
jgi:hypothetical protein